MANANIPHFSVSNGVNQLIVDGKPFLILGGELQNSSASSAAYMEDVWPKLSPFLNTVLASVSWEQIEPEEDQFELEWVAKLITDARKHGLRLVLLWFGSYKNGLSTYVPSWVKKDPRRFSRARLSRSNGESRVGDLVTPFSQEALRADCKAFARLMTFIRAIDEQHHTVIMVQVENEVGLLGDSRDRCNLAEAEWHRTIPRELCSTIQRDWSILQPGFRKKYPDLGPNRRTEVTTWAETSEDLLAADELFMAYHYAQYVETVASAGKAVYPLPLFTNVWQNYEDQVPGAMAAGGGKPGDYPCGGGVPHVLDVWMAAAPTLSMVCPDIYLNDYEATCAMYKHRGQPVFIPEQRRDDYGARRVWAAFGSFDCIGTAPFGIDTVDENNPFLEHYRLLKKVSRYILDAQGTGRIAGFFFDEITSEGADVSPPRTLHFGRWTLTIERSHVFGQPSPGSGIVIHLPDSDRFLLVGWGFQVAFTTEDAEFVGILHFEEKDIEDGELRTLRLLNGDETRSGKFAVMPSRDPDYGGFPISITIPAGTGIAIVEPYAIKSIDL